MRFHKPEMIGGLLDAFLRQEGLEMPLNEFRAVQAWGEVAGSVVERYTGDVSIRGGKMWVEIKSAPLRHNLMMMRPELVRQINQKVGSQVISDIVLR